VKTIAEDLSSLPPKRLARRLDEIARDALPCVAVNVFDGNPKDGVTAGLWVEAQGRRDVLDLARVLETEPGGHVTTSWSLLHPSRTHPHFRLLLHVHFERPVRCDFVVRFDVRDHVDDTLRAALPLLLATNGFALGFDGFPDDDHPVVWVPAPAARNCVAEVINGVGI
jgi:hypothetical protein